MAHIKSLFDDSVVLMDGGMGTTLETNFSKAISNTPLWSANVIMEDPEAVINAHLAFLRAGATVIITATYQCAFETFMRAGYSKDQAAEVWKKGVRLADEARRRFLQESSPSPTSRATEVRIALSIGPFGATPVPTQEFDGFYPPPFGPQEFPGEGKEKEGRNYFLSEEIEDEAKAIQALADFHATRLEVYISDPDVWDMIDLLAFETVPVVREMVAIRHAVGRIQEEYGEDKMKPWWICGVFPFGKLPERRESGEAAGPREGVQATLGKLNYGSNGLPCPSAIGINCCGVEFLADIADQLASEIKETRPNDSSEAPWMILYPNGGDVYDTILRRWRKGRDKVHWAEELNQVVQSVEGSGVWGGIVVGGCCRTGPEEIEHLFSALKLH